MLPHVARWYPSVIKTYSRSYATDRRVFNSRIERARSRSTQIRILGRDRTYGWADPHQHLPRRRRECITQPARTRNTISIWIWMPYEVTRILLPPGPPSAIPPSLFFMPFFFHSSIPLSLSPCSVVFFTMHERGWSTCNGKQRASRGEKRWRERWPGEREGEAVYGVKRKMMQEEERGGWMRACEMVSEAKWLSVAARERGWTTNRSEGENTSWKLLMNNGKTWNWKPDWKVRWR